MTDLDYRGSDLRRRSFAEERLDGADFSGADLRGADFWRAQLRGASFKGAHLGLSPIVALLLFGGALAIVASTGWLIGWTLRDLVDGLDSIVWEDVLGRVLGIAVIGFFIVCAVAFGLPRALRYGAIAFAVGLAVNYIVIGFTSQEFDFVKDGRDIGVLLLLAAALVAGGIARVVGGTFATWAIVIVGLTGGFAAGRGGGGIAGIVVSLLLVVLAKRTLRNDPRDSFSRRLVNGIVSRRGTRFNDADLSGADFTGTELAQSDLSGAKLDGAKLEGTVGWPPFVTKPDQVASGQ